jgi:hypothetical protein
MTFAFGLRTVHHFPEVVQALAKAGVGALPRDLVVANAHLIHA